MIQYAKSRICGQYSVDTMNVVYYTISSFSFFFYLPLQFEPSVDFHCRGICREGLHVGLDCNSSNLIPRSSEYARRGWWLGANVSNW